jgi:hypothetical protein
MKRLASFFAVIALAFVLACGKESDDLLGNWQLDLGQTFGVEAKAADIDQILSFRNDGSFSWKYSEGVGVTGDLPFSADGAGTWEYADNTLTLSDASGVVYVGNVQFSYDRKAITLVGQPRPMTFNKM